MNYDLHVHSTYSDGCKTISELGEEAKKAGLAGFALTDHDTIVGWREIAAVEAACNITIIPGVELSTEWENTDVHILGYCIKSPEDFRERISFLAEARVNRLKKMVAKLCALGMDITEAEVRSFAGDGTVGRPHIGEVLVNKGYARNKQEAFDRYLNRGKPGYAEREKISPLQGIEMIKDCGGYAVLAHPGLDHTIRFLDPLKEAGLDGIEAYHSSHNRSTSKKFLKIAEEQGLFVTAGSDYHGYFDQNHGGIGSVSLEFNALPEFIIAYLEEHQSCGKSFVSPYPF